MVIDLDVRGQWKKPPPFALLVFFIFHCFLITALLTAQGVLLLYGAFKKRPTLLFAWVVIHFVEYITRVDLLILLIVNTHIEPFEPKDDLEDRPGFDLVSFFSFTMVFFITLCGVAGDVGGGWMCLGFYFRFSRSGLSFSSVSCARRFPTRRPMRRIFCARNACNGLL